MVDLVFHQKLQEKIINSFFVHSSTETKYFKAEREATSHDKVGSIYVGNKKGNNFLVLFIYSCFCCCCADYHRQPKIYFYCILCIPILYHAEKTLFPYLFYDSALKIPHNFFLSFLHFF